MKSGIIDIGRVEQNVGSAFLVSDDLGIGGWLRNDRCLLCRSFSFLPKKQERSTW